MADPYLYADTPVLKNKLDIRDEKVLDLVEAEQSRANMMLLYERGFSDFTPAGLCEIHRFLFGDIYDWAGEYRIINIEKREKLLAGRSVWYSNDEDIPRDLENAFQELLSQNWPQFSRQEFVRHLITGFPKIWQVHPFREGNTRTLVMLMTFFVEHHGFYMDQELLSHQNLCKRMGRMAGRYLGRHYITSDRMCSAMHGTLWFRAPDAAAESSICSVRLQALRRDGQLHGRIKDCPLYPYVAVGTSQTK